MDELTDLREQNIRIANNIRDIDSERMANTVKWQDVDTKRDVATGNYDKLINSEKQRVASLKQEYDTLAATHKNRADANAILIATAAIAHTPDSADILASIAIGKVNEGASVEDVIESIKHDSAYGHLIKGIDSSGGSAIGGSRSSYTQTTMERSEFDTLSHQAQEAFIAKGYKVVNST